MPDREVGIRLSLKDSDRLRRELVAIGKDGQRALRVIEQGAPKASRGLLAMNRATSEAKSGVAVFAARLGPVSSGLTALGPAGIAAAAALVGVGLAAKAMTDQTKKATEFVAAIQSQAQVAGLSAEAFQELAFAGEQLRVKQEALTDGFKELQLRADEFVQTGKGPGAEAFIRLGFSQRELQEGLRDTTALFEEVVRRTQDLDRAAQLRVFDEIFGGQAGEQFVKFANAGAAAIGRLRQEARDLGLVLDDEMVARSEKARREAETLERVIDVQLTRAFVDLGPLMVEFVGYFAEAARLVADIADVFKDLEKKSTSGLQARARELEQTIAAIETADGLSVPGQSGRRATVARDRRLASLRAELDTVTQELIRRQSNKDAAGGGLSSSVGGSGISEQIQDVIKDLEFQLDQLGRTDVGQDIFTSLRAAGLDNVDSNLPEVQRIRDLVTEIERLTEAEKKREEARKEGVRLTESLLTAEEKYQKEMADTNRLLEQGAITQETAARAFEDAERRKLDASKKAADGIKRAARDYAEEAGDAATQYSELTRSAFTGLEDSILSLADTTQSAGERIVGIWRGVAEDLARIGIRKFITGPIASAIFGGDDGGGFLSSLFHNGGVVGGPAPQVAVHPAAFRNARRFHGGGGYGLRPYERPAVLKVGEEVLTENNPRHRKNFGGFGNVITVAPNIYVQGPAAGQNGEIPPEVLENMEQQLTKVTEAAAREAVDRRLEERSRRGPAGQVGNRF